MYVAEICRVGERVWTNLSSRLINLHIVLSMVELTISQVNLAGTNHVWLSRDDVAHELLSRRSAIYSDRPFIPALKLDNRTSGQYQPLMSVNPIWARQRKFTKQISKSSTICSWP